MSKIDRVKNEVDKLYQTKNQARAEWADWLYVNHVYKNEKRNRYFFDEKIRIALIWAGVAKELLHQ